MKYRSEIDGLRTVAVLPVILFHAGFEAFAGGFVGVDVFFVLSGYLITTILLAEIAEGRFSILRFYERRARRILPALYFVILVTLPFAFQFMLRDELISYGRAILSVIVFASNFYFWQNTNYFSRVAEENPMLHTWSLAVEEQYYMLFPLALLLLWRWKARGAAIGIVVLALGSLALAEIGSRVAPVPNFFLLPTRAWELGIGALAALALFRRDPAAPLPGFAPAAAALGLAMILGSVWAFDAGTPFPSVYALVPTVGTALVVLYARADVGVGRLLSLPPVVFLGLISYSAYLWHQPLFAFARITSFGPPSPALMIGLALLSLALAALTWRYVERPFRDRAAISGGAILRYGLGASFGLALLAGVGPLLTRGVAGYPEYQKQFGVTLEQRADYVERGYNALEHAEFVEDGRPKLLIIGDSFSQDFYNMVRETGAFPGYQIITRRVNSNCQLYLGPEDITRFLEPPAAVCAQRLQAKDMLGVAAQADVVVFALSFRPWSGARIAETVKNFGFRDDQKVVVIGRKNFGYFNPRRFFAMAPEDLPALRSRPNDEHLATNAAMEKSVPPALFVDTQKIVCGEAGDCPLFTPAGELITFDGNHLTAAGAKYIGSLLLRDPRLAAFAPGAKVGN